MALALLASALGSKEAASVTIIVPLRTATGILVEAAAEPAESEDANAPDAFAVAVLIMDANIPEDPVTLAAARAFGKADFNIPGKAEARALGRFETISARAV